jgi:hypothetical protein
MSLALPQRYQISERDIPQRLAVSHGTRGGGPAQGGGNSRVSLPRRAHRAVIYRTTQSGNGCSGDFALASFRRERACDGEAALGPKCVSGWRPVSWRLASRRLQIHRQLLKCRDETFVSRAWCAWGSSSAPPAMATILALTGPRRHTICSSQLGWTLRIRRSQPSVIGRRLWRGRDISYRLSCRPKIRRMRGVSSARRYRLPARCSRARPVIIERRSFSTSALFARFSDGVGMAADRLANPAVEQAAGSHSLAEAAHRERSAC